MVGRNVFLKASNETECGDIVTALRDSVERAKRLHSREMNSRISFTKLRSILKTLYFSPFYQIASALCILAAFAVSIASLEVVLKIFYEHVAHAQNRMYAFASIAFFAAVNSRKKFH